MLDPAATIDQTFDTLERWLALEGEAERARMAWRRQLRSQSAAERTGESLVRMRLADHQTGLGGRWLLDFAKPDRGPLPLTRLKVGSPVVVSREDDSDDHGVAGVVSRKRSDMIQVATDVWPDGSSFRIDLSPDETTRRRQLTAIAAARLATGRTAKLRDVLLGKRAPRFGQAPSVEFLTPLNPPQQHAVTFALSARDVAILHGPPGTGKTTTLAEVIFQATRRNERVLACAPSNTAVDNLLERLVAIMPGVLRVGHPARVFAELRGHTLDELVDRDPTHEVIRQMRREVQDLVRAAEKGFRGQGGRRRRRELFAAAGQLRGQIRSLEKSIVRGVLDAAEVVCTTTTIDDELLGDRRFDLVVIDEACQTTLPSVWQAILRADRLVLAGDHCQLPPTVLSDEAAKAGMRDSLMQRLVEHDQHAGTSSEPIFRQLTVQYRMHEAIMSFSSDTFYQGSLVADASVQSHRLCDLPAVIETQWTDRPLDFIDSAGAGWDEEMEADGESKLNPAEANLVVRLVGELIAAKVEPGQIAIIAPYAAQVRYLRNRLDLPDLEVDTVDGFQGREKEVVLLTMVRSNERGEIGFLADTRRTNVAMTRARRKLIVVGDSATLATHPFYASMLEYFETAGAYRTVWEFTEG